LTYEEIRQNEAVNTYIRQADAALATLGFTEHSFAHVTLVAEKAGYILQTLGYPERTVELAKIAGYLHDIGNLINRVDHSQSGAIMAFRILDHLKFEPEEIAVIVSAIGNHDEGTGVPVSPVAAGPPSCKTPAQEDKHCIKQLWNCLRNRLFGNSKNIRSIRRTAKV